MTWLSIISATLAILQSLTGYLRDRRMIDDATAAAMLKGMRESDEAINRARKARDLVRDQHARDPDSIMHDDEFQRRDE